MMEMTMGKSKVIIGGKLLGNTVLHEKTFKVTYSTSQILSYIIENHI